MTRNRAMPSAKGWTTTLLALSVAVSLGGCELNVENTNDPDAARAFVDPAGLQQLLGGAFRTWVEMRGDYLHVLPLTAMADNLTASWNNAAIRFYSSVGSDCSSRCGWTNSATAPEAAGGPSVESAWYGYYTVLSSATDILRAVDNGLCFDTDCSKDDTQTSRNVAVAKWLQGMSLGAIALLYDQGFAIDENTDLSDPLAIPFNTRNEIQTLALQKYDEAFTEAGKKPWTTPPEWMGIGAGKSYTNVEVQKFIRTMAAELIALFPRNGAENSAADWGRVATYASQGVSSPGGVEFEFYIDLTARLCAAGGDCVKTWANSIGTMRVDTRVASLITQNHLHPWPDPAGNPCPTVPRNGDKRVGDGSYGPEDDFNGYATLQATANAGTDYACSGVVIFPAARGQYHQSNLQMVRYQRLGASQWGETLPTSDGTGQDPLYTKQMNDLLWAEGLIRSGGNLGLAAQLINNSRVGRGGRTPVSAADGVAGLLTALQYEQEIEFMAQGPTAFFNRRRVDGLILGTPRHMPVPAKELDVLVREIYTFGGSGPDMLPGVAPGGSGRAAVRSVREINDDYRKQVRRITSAHRLW